MQSKYCARHLSRLLPFSSDVNSYNFSIEYIKSVAKWRGHARGRGHERRDLSPRQHYFSVGQWPHWRRQLWPMAMESMAERAFCIERREKKKWKTKTHTQNVRPNSNSTHEIRPISRLFSSLFLLYSKFVSTTAINFRWPIESLCYSRLTEYIRRLRCKVRTSKSRPSQKYIYGEQRRRKSSEFVGTLTNTRRKCLVRSFPKTVRESLIHFFAFCFSPTFAIYLCPLLMALVHTNSIIII